MTRQSLVVAMTLTLALVVLPSAAGADHAGDFINDVRERFQTLRESLDEIAEHATTGDLDVAVDAVDEAQTTFDAARDDIGDLAPQEAELLQSFLDGLATAAEERDADDLTALARSAASTMDAVMGALDAYEDVGTTVEVESAELDAGASTTLALFVRDVPSGLAGYEINVRFDPEQIRVDDASLETGRGATRIDQDRGSVSFNGVVVEIASRRAPPDVLALGTFQLTARGDADTDATLTTEIREIVDLDGNRLPALDRDATVKIR